MARPTDYNEEILIKSRAYLDGCIDKERQLIKSEGKDSTSYDNKLDVNLPSIAGLARHLDISRRLVYEWATKHEEFKHILEDILVEQEKRLINKGLSGDYNANIAKLVLGKHGYHDKVDTNETGEVKVIVSPEKEKLFESIAEEYTKQLRESYANGN